MNENKKQNTTKQSTLHKLIEQEEQLKLHFQWKLSWCILFIIISLMVFIVNLFLYRDAQLYSSILYEEIAKYKTGMNISTGLIIIFTIVYVKILIPYRKQKSKCKKIKFYSDCIVNGINDLSTPASIAKIKLIGAKLEISETEVENYYYDAKSLLLDSEIISSKNSHLRKKEEEINQCRSLEKFAYYRAHEKRIAMLTVKLNERLLSAKKYRQQSRTLYHASQTPEIDWATRGGLASGIAGGAAGLVIALNAQEKNREIRVQNEKNLQAMQPAIAILNSYAGIDEQEVQKLREEIEKTKIKLVADTPPEHLFKMLNFEKENISVSETGTVSVNVEVSLADKIMIFDDIPGVIDGTISAILMDGDEKVGEMFLVLPVYGIQDKETLYGMYIRDIQPTHQYRLVYRPHLLWAMEK